MSPSTVSDLGKAYKAKYPGSYDDVADDALGGAVKSKYPGSYDDFGDAAPAGPPKVSRWGAAANAVGTAATTSLPQAVSNLTGGGHTPTLTERYDYGVNAPGGVKDLATRAMNKIGGQGTGERVMHDLRWPLGVADAVARAGTGMVDFLQSPLGVGAAATAGAGPAVRAGVGAAFGTQMAPETAESWREAAKDPNATTVPRAVVQAGMNLLPFAHVAGGRGESVTRVSPEKMAEMQVPDRPKPAGPPAVNVVRSGDPALRQAGPPPVRAATGEVEGFKRDIGGERPIKEAADSAETLDRFGETFASGEPPTVYSREGEGAPQNQAERRAGSMPPETGELEERGPSRLALPEAKVTPETEQAVARVEAQPEKMARPSDLPKSAEESAGVFERAGDTYAELFDKAGGEEPKEEAPAAGVAAVPEEAAPLLTAAESAAKIIANRKLIAAKKAQLRRMAAKQKVEAEPAVESSPALTRDQQIAANAERIKGLEATLQRSAADPKASILNPKIQADVAPVKSQYGDSGSYEVLMNRVYGAYKAMKEGRALSPVELEAAESFTGNKNPTMPDLKDAIDYTVRVTKEAVGEDVTSGLHKLYAGGTELTGAEFDAMDKLKNNGPPSEPNLGQGKPAPFPKPSLKGFLQGEEGWQPNKQDLADAWSKTKEEMTDRYTSIADLVAKAKKQIPTAQDAYVAARNFAGAAGKAKKLLEYDYAPILKRAKKDGLLEATKNYALYERYEELSDRGIDRFPNGQTIAQIQRDKRVLEATLGPANLAKVQGHVQRIRDYSNRLLKMAHDGGLIGDEQYQAILKGNDKYVPLQRLAYLIKEMDENGGYSPNSFSVGKQELIKTIQGSEKEIVDPFTAILKNTYRTVSTIERNQVGLKVADLAKLPEYKGVVEPLKTGHAPPSGTERISVLRDGKREDYTVPADVGRAMKGMNSKQIDLVTKAARFAGGMLRAGATSLNAPFIVSNAMRDYQTATAVSRVGFTPAMWVRGMGRAIGKGDVYQKFLESGGSMSGYFEGSRKLPGAVEALTESTAKKVARGIAPWNLVRNLGELTELAPRLGVFEKSMDQGAAPAEAGFNARNATVDFSKSGNAMQMINMWVPFLNARLQGNIALFQSMNPGNRYTTGSRTLFGQQIGAKQAATWNAVKLSALVGVPTVATFLYNHRSKEIADAWDSISESEKRGNTVIVFGTAKDDEGYYTQVVKIPKGDIKAFANPLENFLEYMQGNDPKALGQLAVEVGSDLSPVDFERDGKADLGMAAASLAPPTAKGVLEGYTNKNFYTGRDIVPEHKYGEMRKAPPEEQYTDRTSKAGIAIGKTLGVSPMKVDNFAATQFGGLGRQAMAASGSQKSANGLGAAGKTIERRFVGARDGSDEKGMRSLEKVEEEFAGRKVRTGRDAEGVADKLAAMKSDAERGEYVRAEIAAGRMSEELQDAVQKSIEGRAQGLTPIERSLKAKPVEVRARFIAEQLGHAKTDADRRALIERYEEKGVITDAVGDLVRELVARPQTGPPPVRAAR